MLSRAIHVGAAAIAVAAVFVGSGACGAPQFTYVKNSGEKTYFKVPHDWHEVPTSQIDDVLSGTNPDSFSAAVRKQLWWSKGYDADTAPAPEHLLTLGPTESPIVYVRVSKTTATQQAALSFDELRNEFLPVTTAARTASTSTPLTNFELLHDEVLTPSSSLHGVREIYGYQFPNGVMNTFDLTALVNNDSSKLYVLLIRCSTSCYRARASELDTIAKSFTVRSQ
jgi:hypothetical protein